MKYLLWHYREQMSEFFGKRGRSWHISVVITRSQEEGKCQAKCSVHLFHTCKQNSFAVMSVIEHILNTIKIEYPSEQLLIWGKGSPCLESLQCWSRLFHSVWQSNHRRARGHWTEDNSTFWCQNETTRYYCRKHSASHWNFPVHGNWMCSQF